MCHRLRATLWWSTMSLAMSSTDVSGRTATTPVIMIPRACTARLPSSGRLAHRGGVTALRYIKAVNGGTLYLS